MADEGLHLLDSSGVGQRFNTVWNGANNYLSAARRMLDTMAQAHPADEPWNFYMDASEHGADVKALDELGERLVSIARTGAKASTDALLRLAADIDRIISDTNRVLMKAAANIDKHATMLPSATKQATTAITSTQQSMLGAGSALQQVSGQPVAGSPEVTSPAPTGERDLLQKLPSDPFGSSGKSSGGSRRPDPTDVLLGPDPFEPQTPTKPGGAGPTGGSKKQGPPPGPTPKGKSGPTGQLPDPLTQPRNYGAGPGALPNTPGFGGAQGGGMGAGGIGPGSFGPGGQFGPGGLGGGSFGPGGSGFGPGGGFGRSGIGHSGGQGTGYGSGGHGPGGSGGANFGGGYGSSNNPAQAGEGYRGGTGAWGKQPSDDSTKTPTPTSTPDPKSDPNDPANMPLPTPPTGDTGRQNQQAQEGGTTPAPEPEDQGSDNSGPAWSGAGGGASDEGVREGTELPSAGPVDVAKWSAANPDIPNNQNMPDPDSADGGGEGPSFTPGFHFTPHGGNTGGAGAPDPVDMSWSPEGRSDPFSALLAGSGGGGDDWGGNNPRFDPGELADPETSGRYRGNDGYKPDPETTGPGNPHSKAGKAGTSSKASRFIAISRSARLMSAARTIRFR